MSRRWAAIAVAVGICVLAYLGWRWASRPRPVSQETAAEAALRAATPEERELAAVRLTQFGKPAVAELVRVLQASPQPEVRAACIRGLAEQWSYRNMPALLDALEDESALVRAQAAQGVCRLMRITNDLRWDEPAPQRAEAVKGLRAEWRRFREMPLGAAFIRQQEGEKP